MQREAVMVLNSWAGRCEVSVTVIAETPKRYRIQNTTNKRIDLPGRWLDPGDKTLVPKTAVRFKEA